MISKKSIFLWILIIFLFWVGIFKKTEIKSPKLTLQSTIEQAMVGTEGRYGIVIKNFKTGESYRLNDRQVFQAGSLYKLWVMATVFQKIKEGSLKEDDLLSGDISVLNKEFNISPEEAESESGAISLDVSAALKQMITISHNYAALLLSKAVKLSSVEAFLKENGFRESALGSDTGPPEVTPSDIALFYEKLYKGELVGPEYTEKMADLLKNQQLNNGLPKFLPSEVKIAHKTGDIGLSKHDAGIVFLPDQGDYLIVILSESDYPPGAQERIALLSKAVYDYFNY